LAGHVSDWGFLLAEVAPDIHRRQVWPATDELMEELDAVLAKASSNHTLGETRVRLGSSADRLVEVCAVLDPNVLEAPVLGCRQLKSGLCSGIGIRSRARALRRDADGVACREIKRVV